MKKNNLKLLSISTFALTLPIASIVSNCFTVQTVLKNESTLLNNEKSSFSGKINNRDVYYDIDSLCNQHDHNNNHPITGYYADNQEKFSIDRNSFNCPIYIDNSIQSIPDDFLYNCDSFNQKLDLSKCTFIEIGNNFLRQCLHFCADIEFPSTLTIIGNYFLSYDSNNHIQTGFNKSLNLKNVESIGNNFLSGNNNFNSVINLNNVVEIGKWFLAGCYSFGCNITIPSSCKSIGEGFMVDCRNFDSTLTIESPKLKWEIGSGKTLCSTCGGNWKLCQNGFFVKANNASTISRNDILKNFKNSFTFKNGEDDLYRHYRIQSEVNITKVSLITKPTQTKFEVGEKYSSKGAELKVRFEDKSSVIINSGFTTNWDDKVFTSEDVGTQNVIISYGNKTCEYEINVTFGVTSIEIYNWPYKDYFVARIEPFKYYDLSIKANYSDGSFKIIKRGGDFWTNICEGSMFDYRDVPVQKITVHYKNKTCFYYVNVVFHTIIDAEVSNSSKHIKTFKVGEKFSSKGLILRVGDENANYYDQDKGYSRTNFDNHIFESKDIGKQQVKVIYCGMICYYDIIVTK